jgi:hypothetical protein
VRWAFFVRLVFCACVFLHKIYCKKITWARCWYRPRPCPYCALGHCLCAKDFVRVFFTQDLPGYTGNAGLILYSTAIQLNRATRHDATHYSPRSTQQFVKFSICLFEKNFCHLINPQKVNAVHAVVYICI